MSTKSIVTGILLGGSLNVQAALPEKTVTTPSGIEITTIKEGIGENPTAESTVSVHYRGTLMDGKEFDSSYKRGEPAKFPLKGVIPCWTEALQTMKVGGKIKMVCPAHLAYGEKGVPGIPPNSKLKFEVELLKIVQKPKLISVAKKNK